jgi:hypothetical protein
VSILRQEIIGEQPGSHRKRDDGLTFEPDAVRAQAERVLADPLFQKSQRYSNLLKFIVERALSGQHEDLKERIIGIEIFGRRPDYDTSLDPTVRVAANEVRKRLAKYYSQVEHEHELRIELPARSYIAEFRAPEQHTHEPELTSIQSAFRRWYVWGPAAMVVVALAVWVGLRLFYPAPMIDRFWAPVLKGPGPILLCISSAGPETGATSAGATPLSAPGWQPLPSGQAAPQDANIAVGMLDVNAINKLAAYLRSRNKDFVVRAAQGIRLVDLRSGPAILYGSYHNEWSNLLEGNLRFHFSGETNPSLRWIEDASNPASRNWSIEASVPYEQINGDYALVTRAQDPNTGHWWIGIGGLTGEATLAINQFLLDPASMSGLAAHLPRGWDRKNLQIVFEVNVIHGSAGAARVVAATTW